MVKQIVVAFIGCGDFAKNFVPLFKNHPYVKKVYVCDLIKSRAENYSRDFGVEVIGSFEEALSRKDITAVAVFAQRHLHGTLVIKALEAGKDVYSAVPMGTTVRECEDIIDAVKRTGQIYMMGETCVYYPCAMYCHKKYENGDFGHFVFGESQYFHDISHFPDNFKADLSSAGVPPFFYPTHSTSMVLYAADSYVKKVVGFGYKDHEDDKYFDENTNEWGNVYSNNYSLMILENGGTARVNECRRIGYKAPSSYISGFYGTAGSYQFSNAQHIYMRKTKAGVDLTDVSDLVNPYEMTKHKNDPDFKQKVANHVWQGDCFSPQQESEIKRLPESFKGLPNGHMASHQFLVDDFCRAAFERTQPKVNAWKAARCTIPGLMAYESILRGNITLDVPDFGNGE